ncbi:hypothetical protein [Mediterraneibacter faecis]|uniref:hypothetical protein n=1 Tax=Mediterraneibacter faecis TaxID=592978 RepID=UPI001D066355|nr:hypothetical protein [Mediterraneibacter faecis]MCB7291399.1 hypothetical protein [Mediterraneibacter faecis]
MSKEIRELEENSKRIIENMRPQTIAQYHIKQWLDDNFLTLPTAKAGGFLFLPLLH